MVSHNLVYLVEEVRGSGTHTMPALLGYCFLLLHGVSPGLCTVGLLLHSCCMPGAPACVLLGCCCIAVACWEPRRSVHSLHRGVELTEDCRVCGRSAGSPPTAATSSACHAERHTAAPAFETRRCTESLRASSSSSPHPGLSMPTPPLQSAGALRRASHGRLRSDATAAHPPPRTCNPITSAAASASSAVSLRHTTAAGSSAPLSRGRDGRAFRALLYTRTRYA